MISESSRDSRRESLANSLTQEFIRDEIISCKIKSYTKNIDLVREVCKLPSVRVGFTVSKVNGQSYWPQNGCQLNPLQRKILQWIKFYSNIDDSIDRPPDRIVYNDKLIAGWLDEQSKKMSDKYEENWRGDTHKVAKSALDHKEVFSFEEVD